MDDRKIQFRVGAVVLATIIIGVLLVALNGPAPQSWVPWAQRKYEVNIVLSQAPGIAENTPIRKNGILIGRVAKVKDLDDRVVVVGRIEDKTRLFPPPIYHCQVKTSVLGDSTIDFVTHHVPQGAIPLKDGDTIQGQVLENPLDLISNMQGDLKIMTDSLAHAGNEVSKLASTLNQTIGQGELKQDVGSVLDKTVEALDKFSMTMDSIDDLVGDKELRNNLKLGLRDLPIAIKDVQETLFSARQTLSNFDTMVAGAEVNLQNLTGFTKPLGERGDEIVDAMLSAVESVDRLLEEVTMFTGSITSSDGTIGRLVSDPELYNNANQLVKNANMVIAQLYQRSLELRPILDDVRILSDKLARNPGRIVGGAFEKGPQVK